MAAALVVDPATNAQPHSIAKMDLTVRPGEELDVTFTPTVAGTYVLNVDGHRAAHLVVLATAKRPHLMPSRPCRGYRWTTYRVSVFTGVAARSAPDSALKTGRLMLDAMDVMDVLTYTDTITYTATPNYS